LPLRPLLALLVGYGFFGAGYIAYMTFIVAVFEGEGATSGQVTAFWVVLGGGSGRFRVRVEPAAQRAVSGLRGRPGVGHPDRGRRDPRDMARFRWLFHFGGVLRRHLPHCGHRRHFSARRTLSPAHWTAAIAALTAAFAVGQCIGPLLAQVWRTLRAGSAWGWPSVQCCSPLVA
jgi:hypothetical protein